MATTPEGKVKKAIYAVLKLFKVWYFVPVSNGMGKHGIPDVICCTPVKITPDMVGKTVGLFVGIEAKAGDNKPTPRQEEQMRQINKAGGITVVINEERLPELRWMLDNINEVIT